MPPQPTSGVRDRTDVVPEPPISEPAISEPAISQPFSGDVSIERAEKISTRRPRSSRPALRVDDVGAAAVAIATKANLSMAPRLLKTRRELTDAPLDHRDAFVLSLIDGKMPAAAIVDIAGMPEREVMGILERLARLGIVSLS